MKMEDLDEFYGVFLRFLRVFMAFARVSLRLPSTGFACLGLSKIANGVMVFSSCENQSNDTYLVWLFFGTGQRGQVAKAASVFLGVVFLLKSFAFPSDGQLKVLEVKNPAGCCLQGFPKRRKNIIPTPQKLHPFPGFRAAERLICDQNFSQAGSFFTYSGHWS